MEYILRSDQYRINNNISSKAHNQIVEEIEKRFPQIVEKFKKFTEGFENKAINVSVLDFRDGKVELCKTNWRTKDTLTEFVYLESVKRLIYLPCPRWVNVLSDDHYATPTGSYVTPEEVDGLINEFEKELKEAKKESFCEWCGSFHKPYIGKIPNRGDYVKLHKPFFSHEQGDRVLNVFEKDKKLWIQRAGTSGVEETPLDCVKEVIRRDGTNDF